MPVTQVTHPVSPRREVRILIQQDGPKEFEAVGVLAAPGGKPLAFCKVSDYRVSSAIYTLGQAFRRRGHAAAGRALEALSDVNRKAGA